MGPGFATKPTDPDADRRVAVADHLYRLATQVVRAAPRQVSLNALATLNRLDTAGPHRMSDLAAIEQVAQPSMTELVGRMVRDGLAERHPSPRDRRVVLVAITEKGRAYLRERRHLVVDLLAARISQLPADDVAALVAAIPALDHLQQLERVEPGAEGTSPAGAPNPA